MDGIPEISMEMPKLKKNKTQENDVAVEEKQSSGAAVAAGAPNGSPTNGVRNAQPNGQQQNGASQKPAQQAPMQTDGAMDTAPTAETPSEIELLAETVAPEIAPISLKRIPNGAELRGP